MIVLKKRRSDPSQTRCVGVAETVSGTLNASNRIFTTTRDYEPGRISLLYNGQALHSPEDFNETDTNEITLIHIAPYPEDILRAIYEYEDCIDDTVSSNSRLGKVSLSNGISSKYVPFSDPFLNLNYIISASITNLMDSIPSIYPSIISSKTTNGFTVSFAGDIDSNNYVLEWMAVGL